MDWIEFKKSGYIQSGKWIITKSANAALPYALWDIESNSRNRMANLPVEAVGYFKTLEEARDMAI